MTRLALVLPALVALLARVLTGPDVLATHSIGCYAAADLG